jgi:hypothetical protein
MNALTIFLSVMMVGLCAAGCKRPAPQAAAPEAPVAEQCLKLPEDTSEVSKAGAQKLHEEVLALLDKPADDATMAFNFKLIDAFMDPYQKSLDQLVLMQTLVCIQKHHMAKITPETFDRMRLDLIFALAKSMKERDLSVAKQKWAATSLGAEKMAALAQLGL